MRGPGLVSHVAYMSPRCSVPHKHRNVMSQRNSMNKTKHEKRKASVQNNLLFFRTSKAGVRGCDPSRREQQAAVTYRACPVEPSSPGFCVRARSQGPRGPALGFLDGESDLAAPQVHTARGAGGPCGSALYSGSLLPAMFSFLSFCYLWLTMVQK